MARLLGTISTLRWQTRIKLWLAALLAGLMVVAFAKLADMALGFFAYLTSGRAWVPLILTPTIGMLTVWLTRRFCPGAEGSGIPQVIAATWLAAKGKPVNTLLSLRIAFGKIFLGALALVGGFSAGREGPSVQVAASVMHSIHSFFPHSRALRMQDLILAGGAAGVAAAFNTPLAGIVFAIEELGRRLETRTSGVLVSTIIISGLVAVALLGNYNYFGHLKVGNLDRTIILPIIVAGLLTGLLGGLFSRLMLWPQQRKDLRLWRWRNEYPVYFAGLCGLLIAIIGLVGGGLSYGSGYMITSQVVSGELVLPWHAPLTRFLATIVSYYSGIPGGIFAPALAVGASLGSNLAQLLGIPADTIPVIALCMAGFLAAVTQAPITSAIIVMEMIDGHEMVISLMTVTLIAKAVSGRLSPELYQHLALGFRTTNEPAGP